MYLVMCIENREDSEYIHGERFGWDLESTIENFRQEILKDNLFFPEKSKYSFRVVKLNYGAEIMTVNVETGEKTDL